MAGVWSLAAFLPRGVAPLMEDFSSAGRGRPFIQFPSINQRSTMSSSTTRDARSGNDQTAGNTENDTAGDGPVDGQEPKGPTSEEWARLRAPFSRHAYVVESRAIGRTVASLFPEESAQEKATNLAIVDLYLQTEAVHARLDRVLGPERYRYRLELGPASGGSHPVLCHLQIGAVSRTGIGTGSTLRTARQVALAEAASAFGIGASGWKAGPIVVEQESWYDTPELILEGLEQQEGASSWRPGEEEG